MINVVNRKDFNAVFTDSDFYIGRGSPLGNPFRISLSTTREEAIRRYGEYLPRKLADGDKEIRQEMNRIWRAAKAGDVNLVCYCAPRACHGDVIKRMVEEKLGGNHGSKNR